MGKGSRPRPVEKRKYDKNYDAIEWGGESSYRTPPCVCLKDNGKSISDCKSCAGEVLLKESGIPQ